MSLPNGTRREWTVKEICDLVMKKFNKRACWFQIKIAQALYRKSDVIGIAATGSGKTLSFWIALLMALEEGRDGMVVVVTPLNILGKKNVEQLRAAGISAVAIDGQSAKPAVFKKIEAGVYQVVVINPEVLMKKKGKFETLWKKPHVVSRLLHFIYDEAHCVTKWATFREEYKAVGSLRFVLLDIVPIYIASATLPPPILSKVREQLRIRHNAEVIRETNDRPNVRIVVRPLQYHANTYQDLDFLIPENLTADSPAPPKFLVFFDSKKDTEAAVEHLKQRLPACLREKIKWFHSTMTQEYREDEFEALRAGDTWGLCVTDAFGMGLDMPNIDIIVQWRATCSLSSLWQRFGRVARDPARTGTAILLVEKKYLDEKQIKAAEAVEKRRLTNAKRKAMQDIGPDPKRPQTATSRSKRKTPSITQTTLPPQSTSQDLIDSGDADSDDEEAEPIDKAILARIDIEQRRSRYYEDGQPARAKATQFPQTKKTVFVPVGGPMDDLINAGTRPGLGCRRKVIEIYFENDKIESNYHRYCDPDSNSGCQRCAPKLPDSCCDLCDPTTGAIPESISVTKTRIPKKSQLKTYTMDGQDIDFKKVVLTWRETNALTKLGRVICDQLGVVAFMTDRMVQRLVDCVHTGKITSLDSLKREVGSEWRSDLIQTYGPSLLEMSRPFLPASALLPPPRSVADDPTSSAPLVLPLPAIKQRRTCSACHQVGHISSNRNCPAKHPQRLPTSNVLPPGQASASTSAPGPASASTSSSRAVPIFPFYHSPLSVTPGSSTGLQLTEHTNNRTAGEGNHGYRFVV